MLSHKRLRRLVFLLILANFVVFLFFGQCVLKSEFPTQLRLKSNLILSHKTITSRSISESFEVPPKVLNKLPRQSTVSQVDCRKLLDGDEEEQLKAKKISQNVPKLSIFESLKKLLRKCSRFRQELGYDQWCSSKTERDFPLAFSILMFKDVAQVERLLRMIYRPHNLYCIHVDRKADTAVIESMVKISNCLKENVFLSHKSIDVRWGTSSLLQAEMTCMGELLRRSKKWKYFINLTGQEFPLKTNYELVKILRAYDGANDVEGTIKRANKYRFRRSGPPPHNIIATKGSMHVVANRDFVSYAIYNKIAQDLLEWTKKVKMPEETFFSTLNHNPQLGIRGTFKGKDLETNNSTKPFLGRFVLWWKSQMWPAYTCRGKFVRGVCVFGVGDLPLLRHRREMFTNKFYWNYEYFAMDCMEELYYNKTRKECLDRSDFDESYYTTLEFVINKV